MGTEDESLDVESFRTKPRYQAIAERLEQQIASGVFRGGQKLPSIRALLKETGTSKNTVISALRLLESKGLISARARSGFLVQPKRQHSPPPKPSFLDMRPSAINIPDLLRDVIARGAAFDIKPMGPTEPESALIMRLQRLIFNAMRNQSGRKTLYYDDPLGYQPLREQLVQQYSNTNLLLAHDDFCITAGCQHALLLALMATCKAGDNVVVESPGFYGVIQLLDELGLNAIEVPCHSVSGLDIESLRRVLKQYKVQACVVTPAFSTPTGACMPEEAKIALLTLAKRYDFALIEDDIYGELGFHFRPKPLKAFDTDDRVILCSSFSKSLSRDLRVGWIAGGRWKKQIQRLKLVTHLASSQAVQVGLAEFMASGGYTRFIRQRVQQLELQRNELVEALQINWGRDIRFTWPAGGLCLWLELPGHLDTLSLYRHALRHDIVLTPGALFSSQPAFNHYLRLSFCHPMTTDRKNAIRWLRNFME